MENNHTPLTVRDAECGALPDNRPHVVRIDMYRSQE